MGKADGMSPNDEVAKQAQSSKIYPAGVSTTDVGKPLSSINKISVWCQKRAQFASCGNDQFQALKIQKNLYRERNKFEVSLAYCGFLPLSSFFPLPSPDIKFTS